MNKFKKITLLSLLSLSAVFVGCDDEDGTGKSTIMATSDVKGVIDVPFAGVQNVDEADEQSFTYTVTIDKPQVVDVHLRVAQISGTAVAGEDFEIPSEIVIPAYATTASGTVKILNDCEVEGMEDFTIQISDIATSNAAITEKTMSFTINNFNDTVSGLELTFDFDVDFPVDDLSTCGIEYDMDFYLFDESFNLATHPSNIGPGNAAGYFYEAATVACPEHLTLDTARVPNGKYYIFYDIYDAVGIPGLNIPTFEIPVTVGYSKCGGIAPATYVQESAFRATSAMASGFDFVIAVQVTDGNYTILDSVDNVIAAGKNSNLTKVKAAIQAAKATLRK